MSPRSFLVHYQGASKRVTASSPLSAVKKAFRPPKGQQWTETLSTQAIRESAIVLSEGSIVGRAMLEEIPHE